MIDAIIDTIVPFDLFQGFAGHFWTHEGSKVWHRNDVEGLEDEQAVEELLKRLFDHMFCLEVSPSRTATFREAGYSCSSCEDCEESWEVKKRYWMIQDHPDHAVFEYCVVVINYRTAYSFLKPIATEASEQVF